MMAFQPSPIHIVTDERFEILLAIGFNICIDIKVGCRTVCLQKYQVVSKVSC